MKDEFGDKDRLEHIIESIDVIFQFLETISLEELVKNRIRRNGIVYEFAIIGEASKHISESLKRKYPKLLG